MHRLKIALRIIYYKYTDKLLITLFCVYHHQCKLNCQILHSWCISINGCRSIESFILCKDCQQNLSMWHFIRRANRLKVSRYMTDCNRFFNYCITYYDMTVFNLKVKANTFTSLTTQCASAYVYLRDGWAFFKKNFEDGGKRRILTTLPVEFQFERFNKPPCYCRACCSYPRNFVFSSSKTYGFICWWSCLARLLLTLYMF